MVTLEGKRDNLPLMFKLLDSVRGGEYISVQDTLSHDEGRESEEICIRYTFTLYWMLVYTIEFLLSRQHTKTYLLYFLEAPEVAFSR